jgi:hypothetical protein
MPTASACPFFAPRLLPPPARSLDEYYEFLTALADARPSPRAGCDDSARNVPPFRASKDAKHNGLARNFCAVRFRIPEDDENRPPS